MTTRFDSRQTAVGAAGGAGVAYGGYLGAGNAIARANDRRSRPRYQVNRKANDKQVKRTKHVLGIPAGKPVSEYSTQEKNAFFANYPSTVPGGKVKRVQARVWGAQKYGRLRPAAAVAGAGAALGAAGMVHHQNGRGHKQQVAKLYVRDRQTSPVHVLETGAGLAVGAWGLGRSRMLGAALARGVKAARAKDSQYAVEALQRAQAMQGVLARTTAPGERHLRSIQAVDNAVRRVPASLRPEVAAAAGMLLVAQGHPMRRDTFHPVNIRIRGGY